MKRIALLGATGSIGTQTLDVIRQFPDRLQLVSAVAGSNGAKLQEIAAEFPGVKLALFEGDGQGIPTGMSAIVDLATAENVDIVVVSVAGVIGLIPTVAAIRAGKQIALASKEVLVSAGEIIMPMLEENGTLLTPIDSEHSAIFQCLQGSKSSDVRRIILTASGGPFRGWSLERLERVTVADALNHPTWNMGGKITIDSATLMNKALELIEAKWLFGVGPSQLEVVVHPQSIIHSLVEFQDGSQLAQLGWPNMRLPIQYALLYPERLPNMNAPWNAADSGTLTFERHDPDVFWGPSLAVRALECAGSMPCVMNAANEEAANEFLRGKISFLEIQRSVENVMKSHDPEPVTLESLLEWDVWARKKWSEVAVFGANA